MRLQDLDYALPAELIAQAPTRDRAGARLLVVGQAGLEDRQVVELPAILDALGPCLLVANDTQVMRARHFGQKESGGKVEVLLVERAESRENTPKPADFSDWKCMVRANRRPAPGTRFYFPSAEAPHVEAVVIAEAGEVLLTLRFSFGRAYEAQGDREESVDELLEREGALPLPPYIRRSAGEEDDARYQTVFADQLGAVAAPTAGLHFTDALLGELRACGHRIETITLHVGPGTFRPVQVEELDAHPMHEERFEISERCAKAITEAKREGRAIVAIGTTVVRALESAARDGAIEAQRGATRLFIKPPYQPKIVDHLMTNFHLPKSTLLALVMAFGGQAPIRQAYAHAIAERYRFFSYGDAMLITHCGRARWERAHGG